ncbi:hypothetical protein [Streptomyces sp. NPDC001492]
MNVPPGPAPASRAEAVAGSRSRRALSTAWKVRRSWRSRAPVGLPREGLVDVSDFLRLGPLLALERRPTEPRGRTVFLQVRAIARQRTADVVRQLFPDLGYALAGADGPFVHREINGAAVDLVAMFELHARLLYDAATRMRGRGTAACRIRFYRGSTLTVGAKAGST